MKRHLLLPVVGLVVLVVSVIFYFNQSTNKNNSRDEVSSLIFETPDFFNNKLINEKRIIEILNEFSTTFHLSLKRHFCWRIGIQDIDTKSLSEIMNVLLNESEKHKIDFASFFYDFFGGKEAVIDCLKTVSYTHLRAHET